MNFYRVVVARKLVSLSSFAVIFPPPHMDSELSFITYAHNIRRPERKLINENARRVCHSSRPRWTAAESVARRCRYQFANYCSAISWRSFGFFPWTVLASAMGLSSMARDVCLDLRYRQFMQISRWKLLKSLSLSVDRDAIACDRSEMMTDDDANAPIISRGHLLTFLFRLIIKTPWDSDFLCVSSQQSHRIEIFLSPVDSGDNFSITNDSSLGLICEVIRKIL